MEQILYRKCKLVGSKTTDSLLAQGGSLRTLFTGLAVTHRDFSLNQRRFLLL